MICLRSKCYHENQFTQIIIQNQTFEVLTVLTLLVLNRFDAVIHANKVLINQDTIIKHECMNDHLTWFTKRCADRAL